MLESNDMKRIVALSNPCHAPTSSAWFSPARKSGIKLVENEKDAGGNRRETGRCGHLSPVLSSICLFSLPHQQLLTIHPSDHWFSLFLTFGSHLSTGFLYFPLVFTRFPWQRKPP